MSESKERGRFVMKGITPELMNVYWCQPCKEAGIEHEVVNVPAQPTDASCWCGAGFPTTMRQCTACKCQDGPWIDAKYFDGGY